MLLLLCCATSHCRVYDNAGAIALMQQTKITLGIEEGLLKRARRKYWRYMREQCSPLTLFYDDDVVQEQGDDLRKMTFHIQVFIFVILKKTTIFIRVN